MQDSFEARMNGQAPTPAPAPTKQKSGKGWKVFSIILLFLLVGGGVFAGMIIVKGNRDTNRLSEVENELEEKNTKITELEKKTKDVELGDLIRLSDTGIYLKYPTTINDLSYTINNGFTGTYASAPIIEVKFTGYKKEGDENRQNILDFANITDWALGTIGIYKKPENYKSCADLKKEAKAGTIEEAEAEACERPYEDDEYYIQYSAPQNIISSDDKGKELESEVTTLIREWLTDSKNYIKK